MRDLRDTFENPQWVVGFFATLVAVVACVFIGSMVATGALVPILLGLVAAVAVPLAAGFYPTWLMFAIPCSLLAGGVAFLANMPPFVMVAATGIAGWFIRNIFTLNRTRKVEAGNFLFMASIIVLCGLMICHMVDARFGFIGPPHEGGQKIGLSAACVLLYFLLSWIERVPERILRWLPVAAMLPVTFALVVDLVSIFVPAVRIPFLMIYAPNYETVDVAIGASQSATISRISALREFGTMLAFLGIVYLRRGNLFHLRGLLAIVAILAGLGCAAGSGYRAFAAAAMLMVCVGIYVRFRRFTLFPMVAGALLIFLLCVGQGQMFELPIPVQRALSWLPGDWDPETKESADRGVDFRTNLWDIFWLRFDPANAWFGRGQVYIEDPHRYEIRGLSQEYSLQSLADTQSWHSGILTTFDVAGCLGLAALIYVMAYGCWISASIARNHREMPPYALWMILFFLNPWPFFWYTGSFINSFPQIMISAVALSVIWRYRFCPGANRPRPGKATEPGALRPRRLAGDHRSRQPLARRNADLRRAPAAPVGLAHSPDDR